MGNVSTIRRHTGWHRQAMASMLLLFAGGAQAEENEWPLLIKPGDTLIGLGNTYLQRANDWPKLRKYNQIPDPKRLKPGSYIRIPVELLRRESVLAKVLRARGDARVRHADGSGDTPLAVGDTLREGDEIVTGSESNLTLSFVDNSRLLVLEHSIVVMDTLRTYGKSSVVDTRLRLQKGQVDTQVTPLTNPAARYQITTPALVLGVRGTSFRVVADEASGISRGEVLEGLVAANRENLAIDIPAGFGTLAAAGETPAPAHKLITAPDLSTASTLLQRVPLRFNWEPLEGATHYHAQVFADDTFEQLLLGGIFLQPGAKWADLPDGKYVLRVRSADSSGLEGLNATHVFTLKARPEPPFLSTPAQADKVYGDTVAFTWSKASQAASYRFQLSAQEDFQQLLADGQGINALEQTQQLPPGKYYWRVASIRDGNDQGPFSDAMSFEMRAIPPSPKDIPPPAITDKQMSFQWVQGLPDQKYQFQMARDPGFTHLLTDQLLDQPTIVLDRPKGGEYFIRARGVDADGFEGPFGATQQIKVPNNINWWMVILMLGVPFAL